MKALAKRITAITGTIILICAFSACTAKDGTQTETSTDKSVLDVLTAPSGESTTSNNIIAEPNNNAQSNAAIELSYTIPEKFKKLFNTTFNDLFAGKDVKPIGAGEGSEIYASEDYPGLKLHFDSDKNFVTAIEGSISYLVPGHDKLAFAEFKQVFGSDSITYSEMIGAYNAYIILDGKYKLMCGEFGDENGLITTFILSNATA